VHSDKTIYENKISFTKSFENTSSGIGFGTWEYNLDGFSQSVLFCFFQGSIGFDGTHFENRGLYLC